MGATQSSPAAPETIAVEFDIKCRIPIEGVIAVAEKAGAAILQVYNSNDFGVTAKGDASPLTKADIESNRVICEGLAELAPHVPIISEENKQQPYSIRRNYQYCFVVDPLDGTREFVKRNGEFAVMIALVQNQAPVLGCVHVPVTGKTYFAVEGQGAFVRHNGENKQIKAAEFDPTAPGLSLVGSASHADSATMELVGLFESPEFKTMGSCLKLLMVAEGEAHVYPRLAPTSEWDTAAADIIVREAGGVVVQAGRCSSKGELLEDWRDALLKEQPLVYNKEDLLNPCFVVFGKRTNAQGTARASASTSAAS